MWLIGNSANETIESAVTDDEPGQAVGRRGRPRGHGDGGVRVSYLSPETACGDHDDTLIPHDYSIHVADDVVDAVVDADIDRRRCRHIPTKSSGYPR